MVLTRHNLLQPDYGEKSFLGLIRSLRAWCLEERESLIGAADHLVFLLIDGLGDLLLQRIGPKSFLAGHQVDRLSAVYPSTTTVALATLATAQPPSNHGMSGWWTFLPERDLSATPLPFTYRFFDGALPLKREEMWPLAPWMADARVPVLVVCPRDYVDSTFTSYLSGERERCGYSGPDECVELVKGHQARHRRSFAYVYWPQFDSACHSFGCEAEQTVSVFQRLDELAEQMSRRWGRGVKVIVSADHGLLDIAQDAKYILREGDPLLDCLRTPPSGEPRNPIFHLKPGCEPVFLKIFRERFSTCFRLVAADELPGLLGGDLSSVARQRFGDFVGVALTPTVMHYRALNDKKQPSFIGYHGGLTADEMRIPLISFSGQSGS